MQPGQWQRPSSASSATAVGSVARRRCTSRCPPTQLDDTVAVFVQQVQPGLHLRGAQLRGKLGAAGGDAGRDQGREAEPGKWCRAGRKHSWQERAAATRNQGWQAVLPRGRGRGAPQLLELVQRQHAVVVRVIGGEDGGDLGSLGTEAKGSDLGARAVEGNRARSRMLEAARPHPGTRAQAPAPRSALSPTPTCWSLMPYLVESKPYRRDAFSRVR